VERENNIDGQSLAPIAPGTELGPFQIADTHAAGRVQFPAGGGRPTRAMLAQWAAAIPRWSKEAITYCVVVEGGDPFSLGWDMPALLAGDRKDARNALGESYALAWQLDCFTKPTIPLVDGLVSGAGAALTLYGTHRVAGPRYRLEVSGVREGWFPDHGLTQVLAQLPDQIGTYLALTGASLGPDDAYRLGLVTQCIAAEAFPGIAARLADADPVDPILDGLHQQPGPGTLAPYASTIATCFSADTVETILERLAAVTGAHAAWAKGARAAIAAAPPLATALTLRLLRENRHCDLREAITRDFRIASRLLAKPEPMATKGPVTPQMLGELLATLGEDDLRLASRADMQAPAL
jgi:enoyl-CoA hydratase